MINVNSFKPGLTFLSDNQIFIVLEAQHSKQGRGQASVKAKVKNLRTGSIFLKTFTGGEKVEQAYIDRREMNFLYKQDNLVFLMDMDSYEQIEIEVSKVEWELNFLKEGSKVFVRMFETEVLDIELPKNIELEVVEAPDAIKGNTQTNPQKKVILETGFEIEAPMFIKAGDKIIVSSEDGKYVGRGK